MSEIKARHIQDFLAGFPASALEAAEATERRESEARPPTTEASLPTALVAAALRALGEINAFLLAASDFGVRPRLRREIARFSERVQALGGATSGNAKEKERLVRRLNRAGALLAEARLQESGDRKAQARLAAELAEEIDRLAAMEIIPAGATGKEERPDA